MDKGMILHTLLGLLLLFIPAGALYLLERKMLRTFAISAGRMLAQLLALCLVVWVLIRVDSAWLLVLWLLVVTAVSAWLVVKRCRLKGWRLTGTVGGGLLAGVLFVGLWLLVLVLPVRVFDPRWFVPVMALLLGHASAMTIRGLNAYVSALRVGEQQYEFLRGNGVPHLKALQPFMRMGLLAVVTPTIANLSTLCLTSMPLLLCGIFIGGMTPINAFALMLHMTIGCVAVSVLSLGITILLADRSLFDKFGKLQLQSVTRS